MFVPGVDRDDRTHDYYDRYGAVLSWARVKERSRIAEIGCWTGRFLHYLDHTANPDKIVGFDIDGPWLDEARKATPHITVIGCDSLSEPIQVVNERFDAIFMLDTIEHVPRGTEIEVLSNVVALLSEDGQLILSTGAAGLSAVADPAWLLVGHRHYSRRRLTRICNLAGLEVEEVGYSGNAWDFLTVDLFYLEKHILRRNNAKNSLLERCRPEIYSQHRQTSNKIWIRARMR